MGRVLSELSATEFERLQRLLDRETGIRLGSGKQPMVCRRLGRRLQELGMPNYGAYLHLLEDDPEERQLAVDRLTTNLTGFFREHHHFQLLAEVLAGRSGPVRLWSAGCSTGEEAWSMAVVAAQALGPQGFEVEASDVSQRVLETARAAIYPLSQVEGLGPERLRFFLRGRGEMQGRARVKPELAARVRFRQLNLHQAWPWTAPFEAIFCRNVLIYFDLPTREELLRRFERALKPGGLLFIGHSESLPPTVKGLQPLGHTTYRRTS